MFGWLVLAMTVVAIALIPVVFVYCVRAALSLPYEEFVEDYRGAIAEEALSYYD